ncbi:hypothetical protein HYH02_009027 [Chlamydomonas schloesseri]|uniref:Rhodanese domain-containing protein n=1 Tax=Chlamydomonas schloesseri TaxID=2026947 RepID=A0A835WB08_9CHLO|nr:hypothetical protein HYH02_009027 [Chlamydomonas schloesseri]|eukprot:KAG2444085.1 hypothetical protein HYH02_009027 [Chlamydomonas schloesseri]
MPVVNVGGPVAWGLVVLVSAWAVRAGRALAGRRKARRNEEEDALVHDPNALQPRFLQHLSATAIRMLIETGALPCAILELAPDGTPAAGASRANGPQGHPGGSGVGAGVPGPGRPGASASTPPHAASSGGRAGGGSALAGGAGAAGASGGAAGLALQRIVPPELAAAVPCMTAAAWVRALAGPEPWRAELTRAAAATAAAAGVAGAGSPGAPGSSVRSSYASSYASSLGRDGGLTGGLSAGGAAAGLRARLPQQQAQRLSLTLGMGGTALGAHNGYGGAVLQGAGGTSLGEGGAAVDGAAATADRRLSAAGEGGTDAAGPLGTAPAAGPGAGYGLNQYGIGGGSGGGGGPLNSHGASAAAAATAGPAVTGNAALAAAVAAAAAAAAANMASLPYPPRHALLVVLGRNERHVAAVTAAAAAAGYSRVATWVGSPEAFAATSLGGPRLPAISKHALWLVLQLGPDPLFHVPATVIDVRRPDERLSYGAIRGTINIPADELAAALALPPPDFRQRYGVPQPSGPAEDVVVLLSRSGRRAAWAAQLCVDAGLRRVFVYGEGVYGWRLEDRVKPYRAYDLGALPPDPEPFTLEEADEAAGLEELHTLGMPLRQGPRPSRFAVASPGGPGAPGGGARGGPGLAMGMGLGMGPVGGMLPPLPAGMPYTGGGLGGMGVGVGAGLGRGGGAAPSGPGAGHHSRGGSGAARDWGWRGRSMR